MITTGLVDYSKWSQDDFHTAIGAILPSEVYEAARLAMLTISDPKQGANVSAAETLLLYSVDVLHLTLVTNYISKYRTAPEE